MNKPAIHITTGMFRDLSPSFIVSRMGIAGLAMVLTAPGFQLHYELSYVFAYYLPVGLFGATCLAANLSHSTGFFNRVEESVVILAVMAAVFYAFMLGGLVEIGQFQLVALNLLLAITVVVYPWKRMDLRWFLFCLAGFATALAISTMLNLNNEAALALVSEELAGGYLAISLGIALGCLACLFLVIDRFTLPRLALFVVCWFGLALSRGRGAFLFAVLVSLGYLLIVMRSKVSTFSRGKKVMLVLIISACAPYVLTLLVSFGLSQDKWNRLIFNFRDEVEIGGRGDLMGRALLQFFNNPVIGNGLGFAMEDGAHPHNMFLQFAVDGGIIGLALIGYFVWHVFRLAWRTLQRADADSLNFALVTGALFLLAFLNLMKSGNSYIGREIYVLAALVIVTHRLAPPATVLPAQAVQPVRGTPPPRRPAAKLTPSRSRKRRMASGLGDVTLDINLGHETDFHAPLHTGERRQEQNEPRRSHRWQDRHTTHGN